MLICRHLFMQKCKYFYDTLQRFISRIKMSKELAIVHCHPNLNSVCHRKLNSLKIICKGNRRALLGVE